jgi:16S rRNA (cytosine1402-N4)-methyltransferase
LDTHLPVLHKEVLEALAVKPAGKYLDATFGRGGHARSILEALGPQGRLIVMDRDPQAIEAARRMFDQDQRVSIIRGSFEMLAEIARENSIQALDGLLFDLGVSSPQLDEPARGFSFQADGPLDMRMDYEHGMSASQWLAQAPEKEITQVLWRYGEEKHARRIAAAIVRRREEKPLERTSELAQLVASAVPGSRSRKHPATKTFQAIRIHLNREMQSLEAGLDAALELLAPGGRLCVISFHSLEDRMVKRFIRGHSRPDPVYAGLPDIPEHARPRMRVVGKAIGASEQEQDSNPRSRSATLRTGEKLR